VEIAQYLSFHAAAPFGLAIAALFAISMQPLYRNDAIRLVFAR